MLYLLIASLVGLAPLQQPAPAPAVPPLATPAAQSATTYVVGSSDVLGIKVFDEPALSGNYNVDADGSITFPFLGRVTVAEQTVRDIEELLTKLLADGYVRRPQVSVEIAQYRSRSIYILGEVRTPGKYTIAGPMALLEVIAQAGSLTGAAGNTIIVQRYKDRLAPVDAPALPGDAQAAEILRVTVEDLREGRFSANLLLQDGDTIFVPQADRFYVTGFVKTPGSFVLQPNMTVQMAIAVAGGFTERGSTRGIKIIRKVNGKEVEISAKLNDVVQPNDTIKVRQRLI